MKKNNKEASLRGQKRAMKNKARKKRAEALYEFNDLAYKVKSMQKAFADANQIKEA